MTARCCHATSPPPLLWGATSPPPPATTTTTQGVFWCQSPRNGITQLSWSLERRPPIARFICWLRQSKRSLINSSRKTWKQVRSVCLSLRLLRHSFYFYFYFEHLNFTWSYLIDTKISWSLDHISWSYLLIYDLIWSLDLIIWWWSKICFFIWTLHYYLHAFDMPLTHVFHWWSTYILHMLLRNMLLPYTWHALNTHFTCVYLEDNTWTLVYNSS